MIQAERFVEELHRAGFGLWTSVPCSYLTPLINTVIDSPDIQYIGAANEGEAVAIAAGARLGGLGSVVMFQNSGLGNAVSPLTSLTAIFQIPVLVIVTWRGEPGGPADEPQHALMGRITPQLLELMGISWEFAPTQNDEITAAVAGAAKHMQSIRTPYAFIMKKETVAPHELQTRPDLNRSHTVTAPIADPLPKQRFDADEVLRTVQSAARPTDVVVATTGYTGRALYALADRPNQFYMVGSMGCASSFGLGLARAQPRRRVIVLDGDGAALMHLGAMPILGHERPPNLVHVLLDNAVHDSTGAQATVAPDVDFATLAAACGYPRVRRIGSRGDLESELQDRTETLRFLHVRTAPRTDHKLPRPEITPPQVAQRLQQWMGLTE